MSQFLTDPATAVIDAEAKAEAARLAADAQQQAAAAFLYAVDLAIAAGLNPATLRKIARERTAAHLPRWRWLR